MARQVLENGVILPAEYSDDWYDDMTSNLTKLDDVIGSDSEKLSSADVGAAALSNNYNDLDNKPTIPTVNDATLTIQKNGVNVQTFTANASSNVTCNITVPTKTSDLTNDSNFVVSSSLATVATSGSYTDLDDKPTINDSTITIQKNGSTVDSFTTNGSAKTIDIPVPTKTSDLTNDSNFVDTSNPAVSSGITSAKVTDYDTHIADTDIHVTASDKTTWNTVTSKANDSDVVHKSGDETVGGVKTFSDNLTIYNSDDTVTPKGLAIRNAQWGMGESGGTTISSIDFLDKNTSKPASVTASKGLYGQSYLRFAVRTKDSQNTIYSEEIYYDIDTSGNVEFRSWHDNIISLGTSAYKWKDVQTNKINGVEPSSLSLPSGNASDIIDISSYITDLSGNVNNYTAPANGWIAITCSGCTGITFSIINFWANGSYRENPNQISSMIPICKGQKIGIYIYGSSPTIQAARFIPCQGNV